MGLMKMLVELLPNKWTVLGVSLSTMPVITLGMAIPWEIAMIVGAPESRLCLRASNVLFVD